MYLLRITPTTIEYCALGTICFFSRHLSAQVLSSVTEEYYTRKENSGRYPTTKIALPSLRSKGGKCSNPDRSRALSFLVPRVHRRRAEIYRVFGSKMVNNTLRQAQSASSSMLSPETILVSECRGYAQHLSILELRDEAFAWMSGCAQETLENHRLLKFTKIPHFSRKHCALVSGDPFAAGVFVSRRLDHVSGGVVSCDVFVAS